MPLGWLDVSDIPFDAVALLERFQLRLLVAPSRRETLASLAVALRHNPAVTYCLRRKCPEISARIDELLALEPGAPTPEDVRRHEVRILDSMQDWLLYVLDPAAYDALPFLGWDSHELLGLADFGGKTVLDIGAGTGRLAFTVSPFARAVYACEPVGSLRDYIRERAEKLGQENVYAVDGLITKIPFPDDSFDITMGAHVFGDEPAREHAELARVTKPGGMVILCPGNNDTDNERHAFLVENGYEWSWFDQPADGRKRKYWVTLPR
ncbi:MAG: class I SAM-dependent methyltransferase [Planctomycetota bacterium]|jgi:SAM-dependent methyltransferase